MTAFLARRFVWFLLTLWVVFTVSFFLMRAVPGGPFDGERKLEPDVKQAIESRYRVNEPLLEQYGYHLGMATGVLTEEGTFRLGFPDLGFPSCVSTLRLSAQRINAPRGFGR